MDFPRFGLALSGGGARALAHIGVLKVLTQAKIPICCLSGTSMGGVIAAAFACGVPIDEIEEKALRLANPRELMGLVDISTRRRGVLEGIYIRDFLADWFVDRVFENLPVRLALPAVDLLQAREIVFTSGLVFPAVLATIAIPGLFKPVEIPPYRLVDGGILNNLPVDRVRELGADVVVGVDAQFNPASEKPWQDLPETEHFPIPVPDFFLDFYRAELIMIGQITKAHLMVSPPDLLMRPPVPMDITMLLGFPRVREIISAGEECARQALPEILKAIGR